MVGARARPKRVLVFGSVGQGKSSLINLLVDKVVNTAGAAAVGVTFEHTESPPVRPPHESGSRYTFVDTAGLNESQAGTVKPKDALRKLAELLTSNDREGFCLAILVHKEPRFTAEAFARNYEIFVEKILADMRVPTLLVKLGLEGVRDWETNWYRVEGRGEGNKPLPSPKGVLDKHYPLFKAVTGGSACTSCTDHHVDPAVYPLYEKKGQETRTRVWREITAHSADANIKLTKAETLSMLCQAWDGVCAAMERFCDLKIAGWSMPWFNTGKKQWQKLRYGQWRLKTALAEIGFSKDEIDSIA